MYAPEHDAEHIVYSCMQCQVCGPLLSTRRGRTVPRLAQIRPHSTYTKHQLPLLCQYNIRCTTGLVTVTLHHPGDTTKFLLRKVNGKEIARIYDERRDARIV
jgi:hypothetical protein